LHRHEQGRHGTDCDSEASEALQEEGIGEHHQVDHLREGSFTTGEVKTHNQSQIAHDQKH
jgi:hypothetical protein